MCDPVSFSEPDFPKVTEVIDEYSILDSLVSFYQKIPYFFILDIGSSGDLLCKQAPLLLA